VRAWLRSGVGALLASALGTAPALGDPARQDVLRRESVVLSATWLNLGLPEVHVESAPDDAMELRDWRPAIEASVPAAAEHFRSIDEFRTPSLYGFWIGLAGMAASIVYVDQHAPRTAGNAIWAAGWLSWLGFAALTSAELDDVGELLREQRQGQPAP
jgi:hypothetical protein